MEQETGHALLAVTEETKIALTDQLTYNTPFDFIEEGLTAQVTRDQFDEAISPQIQKIANAALQCLHDANVSKGDIELVILTGGTTEVLSVQNEFRKLFPNAVLADENKLSSVGLGLAYDSQKKFG